MNKQCTKCLDVKPADEFYTRRGDKTHSWCKSCINSDTLRRQRLLKADAVAYMGGKCTVCKGIFHNAAFEFHHPDPTAKDYSIGKKKNLKLSDHTEELDKCVLVCSNCHKTIHAKY